MSLPEPVPEAVSAMSAIAERANPFKGLAYYERQDAGRFAGRQRDIEAVAAGILRTRTFVVYGRSGLGKTSLLLAGVLPRLMDQGCRTLDVRLLEDPLGDLRRALADPGTEGTEDLASLVERASGEHLLVIVFDQFEEFFIRFADQADPAGGLRSGDELDRQTRQRRIAQREAFIEEIGRLAANARLNLRLVFSLREDWIAEMGDFADAVPEITQHMYRLLPLTSFGVRQAIVETLRSAGTDFDSRLVSALVDALADVHFDPVMLQVLGSEVWERARARTPEAQVVRLELADLEAIGGVRQVFRGYLDQVQAEIEPSDRRRRVLTRAVLDALISEKRTKLALSRNDLLRQYFVITEPELDEVLDRLYRHRLIRSDPRGDLRWYELVHERLIGAILEWFETDLDFFRLRSARNLLTSSCHNRGWRENPELLLNRGQLDDTVGPFKDLLRFNDEERLFLVSSAIYAHSRDLEFWAELAGYDTSADLLDRFLDQTDNEHLRRRAAEAAGRMAERREHFGRRCLDLALHDPSAEVRQAAARSFADLGSPTEHQALAARLKHRKSRKAALDVLTEVVDKEKLPVGVKPGVFNLRQARQRVYKRRLEAAREIVRARGLRGAQTGLLAGLLWSLTAGTFLTRFVLYEWLPEFGVTVPWLWPLSIGAYLLIALPLGTWIGWRTARRTAQATLRQNREGVTLTALGSGPFLALCGTLLLTWIEVSRGVMAKGGIADNIFDPELVLFTAAGLGSVALLGLMVWMAVSVATGLPAVWSGGGRSRSSWIWAWVWAFGASLIVLFLVPRLKVLHDFETQHRNDASTFSEFLVDAGSLSLLTLFVAILMLGGLFIYVGLLASLPRDGFNDAQRLGNPPEELSIHSRRARRGIGAVLAATALALYAFFYGLDGLPCLAHRETLGNTDIIYKLNESFGTYHLRLTIPENVRSPRLAGFVFPDGIRVLSPGLDSADSPINITHVLQPGKSRHLALSEGPIQGLIRPDHPISEVSRSIEPQLVAARFSSRAGHRLGGTIDLSHFNQSGLPFLQVGDRVQGDSGCESTGITVGLGDELIGLPCSSRVDRIDFTGHWLLGQETSTLNVWAWKAVPLSHGNFVGGALSPDGSHVATVFRGNLEKDTSASKEARVIHVWPSNGSMRDRITLQQHNFLDKTLPSLQLPLVDHVVFSPDGRLLAMINQGLFVQISRSDGFGEPVFLGHPELTSVAFSPDGSRLATVGGKVVRIWRTDRAGKPVELQHPSKVYPSISFNGKEVATVDFKGTARVWSVASPGAPPRLSRFALLGPSIASVNFSPDGTRLAAVFEDRIKLWKVQNFASPIVTLVDPRSNRLDATVLSTAFDHAGSRLLAARRTNASIWNTDGSGKPVHIPISGTDVAILSLDGSRVAAATWDGTVRVWKTDGSAEPIVLSHEVQVLKLQFSNDGSRLLTIPAIGPARIWDVRHPLHSTGKDDLFLFLRVSSMPKFEQ